MRRGDHAARDTTAAADDGMRNDTVEDVVAAASSGERHTSADDRIRGHSCMPGAEYDESATGLRADSSSSAASIRGPPEGPGPTVGARVSREQQRLDKLNAGLARSFADHAERVARKRERAGGGVRPPTAAERMAAIRRRLGERSVALSTGGRSVEAGNTSLSSSTQVGEPACHRGSMEADASATRGDSPIATSTAQAASFAAWHTHVTVRSVGPGNEGLG